MPNVEFIARNGIVSRGNLVVSGSVISTSPASFSGSLSLTGDLNFQPGATRFISMSASPTTASGNSIVIQAGDATASGTGGSISILPGAGAGGPGAGTVTIGNTTWWNGATVNGILTATNQGPNTGTSLTVNAGGQLAMRFDWDNINSVTSAVSANRILRFTGASQYQVRGSGTTSSTTAFLVQNANASASFSIRDNGDSTFTYPGIGGYSLKISGSYSGNGASAIYETLGASGGYYGIHEFRIGTNTANAVRTMSIVYGGRVVIGNKSDTVLQFPSANLLIDTNVVNAFTSQSFNTGIIINPSGSLDTRFTASGIQFNFAAFSPNDTNGGAFVGSQYNPATNGYDADLVIYNSQAAGGSYVETARFVGKSRSLSLGAGRNPSASLHISGSSNSALFEIDSPAVNNILFVSGSGNVGIGTGNPTYALEVSGSSGNQGVIRSRRLIAYGGTAGDPAIATDSTIAGLFEVGYAQLGFSSYGGEAGRIEGASRLWNIGMTGGTAKFNIRGTGATSSTTAFLVQNANASSSLSVLDDGTTAVLSSNEKPFTVSHTNGSSALGIVVGNGSALAPGQAALRLNDFINVFTFSTGRIVPALPLTVGQSTETFYIRGGGGGSDVANPSVALTDNTYNAGGYTVTSGTQTTVQIGGFGTPSNAIWKPASGNANYNLLAVAPNMSGSGTYSGIIRGIFYAPTVDSTTYGAHRAIETTAGDVVFNGGRVSISGSAGSGSALYAYKSGSTVLDIQGSQGQLFSVIDALSGSLMSVNDISGLPIVEVFSDDRVVMGTYGAPGLIVSGSTAAVATGSSAPTGTAPEGTFRFAVAGGLYYIYAYIGGAWRSGSLA
jgi:hypothetical protein